MAYDDNDAYGLGFYSYYNQNSLETGHYAKRNSGYSVRLVKDAQ